MLSLSEATPLRSFFSKMLLANQPIRSMPELNLRTVQKIRCLGDGKKKVLRIRSWLIRDKNRRKAFRSHRMDQARACQISPAILKFRPDIIIAFQPESACCITQYFMDRPPIITMMHASPAAFLKHPQTAFLAESDLTVVLLPEYVEQVRQLYGVTHAISIPNAIEEQPPSLYESIKKEKTIICVARISRS